MRPFRQTALTVLQQFPTLSSELELTAALPLWLTAAERLGWQQYFREAEYLPHLSAQTAARQVLSQTLHRDPWCLLQPLDALALV